jgi:DNA-binding transcriptional LysR family regulator
MRWYDRIGRRLKLRDLHILLAVVQSRSMAKAAGDLAISQPAVSKAIAEMERTVGQRLLDRTRAGLEPTPYGRVLIRRSIAIFDELKQAAQELEFLADPTVGELRIGSSEPMAAGLLPAIINRFSRQYPRVVLTVVQAVFATTQYRELRDRNVDMLFGRIWPSGSGDDDLETELIYDDQAVVVAGRRSRWAASRRLSLADLEHVRWVLPPADSPAGAGCAEAFRAVGSDMPCALSTLSVHLALQLVATGRYVAMLPGSILRFGGDHWPVRILPVKLPVLPRPIGVITLKHRTSSPVAKNFIDCARGVVTDRKRGSVVRSH